MLLLSPLSDEVDRLYLHKIKAMVWSMFVGMFVIAIGQGLIMGLLYWFAGVPYLGPLTLISIVAAMLPLGASLIALPVGIVSLLLGNYIPALIILAGYLLIVANIDNLVRPRLVSKDAYLSFAAVMVSALGGYALFGFFGVIYGPVLMILFQTTVDVYQEHYLAVKAPLAATASRAGPDKTGDNTAIEPDGDSRVPAINRIAVGSDYSGANSERRKQKLMRISGFFKGLIHVLVIWIVNAISLAIGAWLLPGISMVESGTAMDWVLFTMGTALVLALVNIIVRPIVLNLAKHLDWVWTLVFGFLVNAFALWITAWIVPGFDVSILAGLLGGIVIAFFNTVLLDIFHVHSQGSWYQRRIEKLAQKDPFEHADEPGRGLMMVEIDGLSYWHIQKALDEGLMPTMTAMMESEDYHLTRVECGLPSMTSSCQAGIMFGDNYDIPAYRWWDKSKKKLYVSANDAAELNDRYAHGQGLMRQGSSIMNMMDGDAEKSMFTMSTMKSGSPEEERRRSEDISLLCLNPFFLLHELALFFFEVGRELWQAWQQKRHNVEPRLNRLKDWYPFVRAGCCTIMRDMSAELAILDMMRGAPSIYMLYLGYDEVAHHSGPWTSDAFGDLKHLDKTFARLKQVVETKAKRPYDFVILSDHGQSFGATFKQRYGLEHQGLHRAAVAHGHHRRRGDRRGPGRQRPAWRRRRAW